jgi:hypothetical protein
MKYIMLVKSWSSITKELRKGFKRRVFGAHFLCPMMRYKSRNT